MRGQSSALVLLAVGALGLVALHGCSLDSEGLAGLGQAGAAGVSGSSGSAGAAGEAGAGGGSAGYAGTAGQAGAAGGQAGAGGQLPEAGPDAEDAADVQDAPDAEDAADVQDAPDAEDVFDAPEEPDSPEEEASDPCQGQCTDPHAQCLPTHVCQCQTGYTDSDSNPSTATCVSNDQILQDMTVDLAITHDWQGNLVIKLISPWGQVLTLMSRAGFEEQADDGNVENTGPDYRGDQSRLHRDNPIHFFDGATTSAEQMGRFLSAGKTVCKDPDDLTGGTDQRVCDFHPSPGAVMTDARTFAGAFGGHVFAGPWQLCIGDAVQGSTGQLRSWTLHWSTVAAPGTMLSQSQTPNANISDGSYTGSQSSPSMLCSSIQLPAR